MKVRKRGWKIVALITVIVSIIMLISLIIAFCSIYFSVKLDDEAVIADRAKIRIYDENDEEISYGHLNRYVKYEDINTNIINAFVALEDKRFFKHKGVDYYRTAGALINNIKSGYLKEGGSTITQQLAKNTHFSNEKTLIRKIKEMKVAKDIERKYSKEEILEMYLNAIYYGNGIYGIDAACKKYFGKSPAEVNLSESAILAGIVKSPQKYSPKNYPEKSYQRMKLVLDLMKEQGYIDEEEYNQAKEYSYVEQNDTDGSPYLSAVISEACSLLDTTETELLKTPLKIVTYYDKKLQNDIKSEYDSGNYDAQTLCGDRALSYAAIADNASGGIAAYINVGDVDVNMRRQPGSVIKPILVYCPALNAGKITPADVFVDEKKDFYGYSPSNYHDIYYGNVDVETALKKSLNSVAVEIYAKSDQKYCRDLASKAGISIDKNDDNLALALGGMTYGVDVKEVLRSYMTLANGGLTQEVGFIKEITDASGKTIYRKNDVTERVFSEEAAYLTTDMLIKTAKDGTAKKLNRIKSPIAAKTGTVQGNNGRNTDAWCVSYNNRYTSCVWYGGKDNTDEQTVDITGGGLPALLTAGFLSKTEQAGSEIVKPDSIIELNIDTFAQNKDKKIYLANPNTPDRYKKTYLFDANDRPVTYSPYFFMNDNEFRSERYDEGIIIKLCVNYPYSYRIYEIKEGIERDLYRYETSVEELFDNEKTFLLPPIEANTLYMDVFYQNELVGTGVCENVNRY